MSTLGKIPIIDDDTWRKTAAAPVIDGVLRGRGMEPRDYGQYPEEMFDPPDKIPLIPKSEWSARIKEKAERKTRLSDIRNTGNAGQRIPTIDQGSNGYCWGHSTTQCVVLDRAKANQPYVPLSAYMVCAIIKKGRNEGGWCGLSQKFLREVGICSQQLWPQGNRDLRLDTPEVRANAALHKVTEEWADLTRNVYDQNLTFEQLVSCLLANIPCAVDFNWWAHSVCAMDVVEVEANSFGILIWNSWGESWGEAGTGILRGSKAIPDGAVAIRASGASPV